MAVNLFPWRKPKEEAKPKGIINQVPWDPGFFVGPYGFQYPLLSNSTLIGNQEQIGQDFLQFVQYAYKMSPVIFTCVMNRMMFFSEARFLFREIVDGRPGDYFSNDDALAPLRKPWTNGTTGDLLALAEVHNSLAGNFFAVKRGKNIRPLRPDWVTIVLGSMQDEDVDAFDIDAEVIAYLYNPGGMSPLEDVEVLFPEDVCHYMPLPDPEAPFRGMSWITPVIQDMLADKEMTVHKRKFLEAGGTPNLAVKLNVDEVEEFEAWVEKFREAREGELGNPYRTLFLASAADPVPIGSDMQGLDFTKVQSNGEVRIAAAAKVHPAYAGFSEGLRGSSLSQGNLSEINRQFANTLMRPLWRNFAHSMETIIPVPEGSELWYDDRDIPALQQDETDAAKVLQIQAATITSLITAGYEPDSVVDAVNANDLSRLVHSGALSVQLYPGGQPPQQNRNGNAPETTPATN